MKIEIKNLTYSYNKLDKLALDIVNLSLKDNNIIDSELCSVCNKEYIHSARAEGEGFKRETAIIMM